MTRKINWCLLCVGTIIWVACLPFAKRRKEKARRQAILHGIPKGERRRRLSVDFPSGEQRAPKTCQDALVTDGGRKRGRQHERKKGDGGRISSFFSFSRPRHSIQPSFSQEQSPFFSRLPLEIRLMIYQDVFDCRRVHIVPARGKLVGIPCNLPGSDGECAIRDGKGVHGEVYFTKRGECFVWSDPTQPATSLRNLTERLAGALKLLRMCRRAYVFAAGVTCQAFPFDDCILASDDGDG